VFFSLFPCLGTVGKKGGGGGPKEEAPCLLQLSLQSAITSFEVAEYQRILDAGTVLNLDKVEGSMCACYMHEYSLRKLG
jgi:hypothetical protein